MAGVQLRVRLGVSVGVARRQAGMVFSGNLLAVVKAVCKYMSVCVSCVCKWQGSAGARGGNVCVHACVYVYVLESTEGRLEGGVSETQWAPVMFPVSPSRSPLPSCL